MRVLINGLSLSNKFSGVQYYTENLINNLASLESDNLKIDVLVSDSYQGNFNDPNIVKTLRLDSTNRVKRILAENIKLHKYFKKFGYDILHSPAYILPFNWNSSSIVTVHDTIALDYPEFCSFPNMLNFNLNLKRSIRNATKVIAVSESVKRDIIRTCNVNEDKITVIHNGINPIFRKITNQRILNKSKVKYGLPDNYILFVGNIEPKKNLERLLVAFNSLIVKTGIPHYLVIVGKKGWKYKSFFETLSKMKYSDRILLTDYVSEEDLPSIYSMADVFAFPSLYEGFGYPVLEAMACGTPVVCSTRGALPEISGGNCLFTDANSVEQLADRLYQIINVPAIRQDLIQRGLKWSKEFTMNRSATETLKLYQEI